MPRTIEQLKAKILALLAKAKSTEHKAEADSFFAKASELMEKHQVDLFDLHEEDPIGCTFGVKAQPGPPSYKSNVQVALARYYGAKPFLEGIGGGKWVVRIYGPESARITTELMTDFVWQQVCDKATELLHNYSRAQAIRHIAKALVLRINIELAAQRAKPVHNGSPFAVMVIDATKALIDKDFPVQSTVKHKAKNYSKDARSLAAGISIRQQVGGGAGTLRLN